MTGTLLLKSLVQATGLPSELIERELNDLLICHNKKLETLTLEEVREVLSIYLQETLLKLKDAGPPLSKRS